MCAIYYMVLMILGFRNIYFIFYLQRKLLQLIFPLMYLCGQFVCLLQTVQNFLFIRLNHDYLVECYKMDTPIHGTTI